MSTIVEIDKAGRIVVPKKFRDVLRLTPGTRLKVERTGDALSFLPSSNEARLIIKNGVPLIFPADGDDVQVLKNEIVDELLGRNRLDRGRSHLGSDGDLTKDAL
jgi:AbrB family looped-hinge helix DNA binding protein